LPFYHSVQRQQVQIHDVLRRSVKLPLHDVMNRAAKQNRTGEIKDFWGQYPPRTLCQEFDARQVGGIGRHQYAQFAKG
jgi:hypothetical protein